MAKTTNKYWIFLENLRRSGDTNMYGAVPNIVEEFGVSHEDAECILLEWMNNYNRDDYED